MIHLRIKKVLALVIVAALSFGVVGCGGNSGGVSDVITDSTDESKNDQISIENLDYSVESAVIDGKRRVVFSYTNNCDYTVSSFEISYKFRKDIEEKTVNEAFAEFMEMDSEVTYDTLKQTTLTAKCEKSVIKGETSERNECEIGSVYVTSMEQYECYEPDIATIKYIESDGKMYTEYYDFATSTYSVDSEAEDIDKWGDGEMAAALPKPDGVIINRVDESDSGYNFDANDVTDDEFAEYKDKLKNAGFNEDVTEDDMVFYGSSTMYKVDVFYYSDSGNMSAYINTKSENVKEDDNDSTTEAKKKSTKKSKKSKKKKKTNGVDPDLKKALDEYESFMDEYCEFMKKYNSSNDVMSMLNDYTKMLTKYTEMTDKINAIDTDSLSTEDYKYYVEVTSRVSKKLIDAGASM